MKTKILITAMIFLFLLPSRAACQGMPVYDNTNFISLVKSLLESAKQTSQLIKSVQFLKDAKESIEKVSNVVKQLRAVEQIAKNNRRLIQVMQDDLKDILDSPYIRPEEIDRIMDSFEAIVQNSLDAVDFIDQILSSDYLKMSDAERTVILKEKESESQEMVAEIQLKTRRYRDIISFRKMQDRINNREINY